MRAGLAGYPKGTPCAFLRALGRPMSSTPMDSPENMVQIERVLCVGTAVAGGGIAGSAIVGVVSIFLWWPIDVRSVLVEVYMLFIAILLIVTSLLQVPGVTLAPVAEQLLELFGFLRYGLGTGLLLFFAGALTFAGNVLGQVAGAIAMLWGVAYIAFYFWARQKRIAGAEAPLLDPVASPATA